MDTLISFMLKSKLQILSKVGTLFVHICFLGFYSPCVNSLVLSEEEGLVYIE